MRHCCAAGLALVPRGGATGLAGGAVPIGGEVVVELGRLRACGGSTPGCGASRSRRACRRPTCTAWRASTACASGPTRARPSSRRSAGWSPRTPAAPTPSGSASCGDWVTGLEAVVPPGDVVRAGGPLRKDVAGYDLVGLLVGSEGTLGVVTAAGCGSSRRPRPPWASSPPAPTRRPGARRSSTSWPPACGPPCSTSSTRARRPRRPAPSRSATSDAGAVPRPGRGRGHRRGGGARRRGAARGARRAAPGPSWSPRRAGRHARAVALARRGLARRRRRHGGKLGEDVAVPVERLADLVRATRRARRPPRAAHRRLGPRRRRQPPRDVPRRPGRRRGAAPRRARPRTSCWPGPPPRAGRSRASTASASSSAAGSRAQWDAPTVALHRAVKRAIDPDGLMNPGKKEP